MAMFRRGAALALAVALTGCGGGGPSDAEVVAAVRAVLAGAVAQAPATISPDALTPAQRQAVMAVGVGVGDHHANGDGSFDVGLHVRCNAPGGTVDFTQAFDVLRAQQGWSLSVIGAKALLKVAAPCLASAG